MDAFPVVYSVELLCFVLWIFYFNFAAFNFVQFDKCRSDLFGEACGLTCLHDKDRFRNLDALVKSK